MSRSTRTRSFPVRGVSARRGDGLVTGPLPRVLAPQVRMPSCPVLMGGCSARAWSVRWCAVCGRKKVFRLSCAASAVDVRFALGVYLRRLCLRP